MRFSLDFYSVDSL